MILFTNIITYILISTFSTVTAKTILVEVFNILDKANNDIKSLENNSYLSLDKNNLENAKKVKVQLYYECLCPDCIQFDTEQFRPVVEKLHQFLDLHIYPYGNAKTIVIDGEIGFECQHGPKECYGNKLHACAIDNLQNITKAVLFNACMMEGGRNGSNDEAADKCAVSMHLDSEPIKKCAKGQRGTELLKYYGEESKKANFNYVPYILINGKLNDGNNFMDDICKEFKETPPPCLKYT